MVFRKRLKEAAVPAPVSLPRGINDEPDLRGLGRVLWEKRKRILSVSAIAAAAAFVIVNAITPRYLSEARLLLDARQNVFLRAAADKNIPERTAIDPEAVASQIQLVLSRDLASKVIKKENLTAKAEFDPDAGRGTFFNGLLRLIGIGRDRSAMSRDDRTLEAYYDRLRVYAVDKSRVIAVDFSSANPELAARVANDIAETYLQMQQLAQQDQTRAAGSWLAGEIDKMRQKVKEAEDKVEQYRTNANLFVGANNTPLPNQQMSDLNTQIAAARGQQADLEARARQMRALIKSGKLIESSDIANSDTMRRLIDQRIALRAQLAEQSTTLLPRHPRIMELKAQIAEIDSQIRKEGERLARQLDNDAKVAGDRLQTLTDSLDQVKKLASQSNAQDVELRALQREANTQRDLLEAYLAKYREASARDSIHAAPPEARIISRAAPSIKPSYPKKLATVLIAAFAGFALSAGFTVTGALLAPPIVGYGYSQASTGARPVMASVPFVASPSLTTAPPEFARPAPAPMTVSSIKSVAADLRQAGDGGRRVAVIGATRHVGSTSAAIALARALAQEANVVLVDMAFADPSLASRSSDTRAPGLADLLRGTASFDDVITRDSKSNLQLVAAGLVGNDGPTLAASPTLVTVIEALVRSYDHVVINAGSAADTALERLAPLARCALLVAANPADAATRAAAERMAAAGFADVAVLAGRAKAAAA